MADPSASDVVIAARELCEAVDAHVAACARVGEGGEADVDETYDSLALAAVEFHELVGEVFAEPTPFGSMSADLTADGDPLLRPGERDVLLSGQRVSVRTRIDFAVTSPERLLATARQRLSELDPSDDDDGPVRPEGDAVPDAITAVSVLLEHEARAPLAGYGDEHGLRAAGWATEVLPVERALQETPESEWPADPFALPPGG